MQALAQRRNTLDAAIAELIPTSPYAATVPALRCFRGIDTLSAAGVCADIGTFARFKHPKLLSGFLGIVPSEYTSDEHRRQGAITKPGPAHARRLLVEAAQHCVDMATLQARASELIAEVTGAEAGLVTAGAAAGLLLGTAACVTGLDFKACTSIFDQEGRFNPSYDESQRTGADAEVIVMAIGIRPNTTAFQGEVELNRNGTVKAGAETLQTSLPYVFAGGDAVTGQSMIVKSVGQGKRAAFYIDRYLRDLDLDAKFDERLPMIDRDEIVARAQEEMIGIAQDDGGAERFQVAMQHALDGALGPDRHEDRRVDLAAIRQAGHLAAEARDVQFEPRSNRLLLRRFHQFLDADEKLHGFHAINDAMVVAEGYVHHGANFNLAFDRHSPALDLVKPQNAHLRRIQDRCAEQRTVDTTI